MQDLQACQSGPLHGPAAPCLEQPDITPETPTWPLEILAQEYMMYMEIVMARACGAGDCMPE